MDSEPSGVLISDVSDLNPVGWNSFKTPPSMLLACIRCFVNIISRIWKRGLSLLRPRHCWVLRPTWIENAW